MKTIKLGFAAVFVLLPAMMIAQVSQVATGTPALGSFGGGPFDVVNLGNLNTHFSISVIHKAGRGAPFNYALSYDSSIWTPTKVGSVTQWKPVYNWGWSAATQVKTGYLSFLSNEVDCYYTVGHVQYIGSTHDWASNYVYHDPWGGSHSFVGISNQWSGNGGNGHCPLGSNNNVTATATDGTGYVLNGNIGGGTITTTSGAIITPPANIGTGSASVTDNNGNKITVNSSGQFFDTLSSTTPVLTASAAAPPTTATLTYAAPADGDSSCSPITQCASYSINYQAYTVKTNFGVSNSGGPITEYGPLNNALVSSIALPDDTSTHQDRYTFTYEQTPGTCTPLANTYSGYCVTGRVASVTLPTGGVINYTYPGGPNNTGIFGDGSTAGLTRALSPATSCSLGPCWQYSRSLVSGTPGPGSTWTTTIIDPAGDQTVANFAEDATTNTATTVATYNLYETQRQINQLSGGTQTLMSTTLDCYNANTSNCATATVSSPITEKVVTLQYPGGGQQAEVLTDYNPYGLVTLMVRTDYGPSGPGANLQSTSITYATLGNNIVNRPSSVKTTDGSGNVISRTDYAYDESAYPVQPTTGTPQHVSVTGSRGNATTVTYYAGGTATISTHFQYYDTGTLYKSWDVNGLTSSYTYDTSVQGNRTKSCNNSFSTKVTSPPTPNVSTGLSVSTAWNCVGGVATSTIDPNGNVVSVAYSDSYFWRAASTQDQLLSTMTYTFTNAGAGISASTESSMLFNGNASISEQLTTVDGFGRISLLQQEEAPSSGNYDSTQTSYDSFGRLSQSSMPFVAGAGQGSTTAAETTKAYDAMGRVLSVTDGGSPTPGYTIYSYSQNDVLQKRGPAPLFQKQMEYDGIGRLTSVCEITAGTTAWPSGSCNQKTSSGNGYLTTYSYGTVTISSVPYPAMTVTQNAQSSSSHQARQYVRDLLGRLIQETNPETGNLSPGTTKYTFDSDSSGVCTGTYSGDLVKKVDNRGNITCYTYDSLHRVQTITYVSSSPDYANSTSKTFVYDAASYNSTAMANAVGRLAEAYTGSSGSKVTDEFFSYSKRGELLDTYEYAPHSNTPYYHASASFWANGTIASLALLSPANLLPSQTFGVDPKGRPSSVTASSTQNPTVVSSTNYDLVNYKTTVNFGSGDSDVFAFDANSGRLTKYTFNVGNSTDVGQLTWNPNGSLGTLQIIDGIAGTTDSQTCNYAHDDLSRIASVNCGNSTWRQNFSYDPFGNIVKDSTGYTGLTFNPTYSAATNQFTSLSGSTPGYDTDGRLTFDTVNNYTWDADSKLHTVDTSPSTTIVYDALGRMVEKAVGTNYTEIIYSPLGGKLATMTAQTLQKGFVPLPSGSQAVYTSSGLSYYRHTDHLGNSRLQTTPSRTLYASTAYAPFGEPYAKVSSPDLSFTSQDQDTASGMHDFLARRYTTTSGRWLSPDPAGVGAVDPANPQTWNRYAYVMNAPLNLVDPFGEECYAPGVCWEGGLDNLATMGGWADPFQVMSVQSTQAIITGYSWQWDGIHGHDEYLLPDYMYVSAVVGDWLDPGGDTTGLPDHLIAEFDCIKANGVRNIEYQLVDAKGNFVSGYNVTEFLVERQTGKPYTGGTTGSPIDTQHPDPSSGLSGFSDGLGGFGFRDIYQTFTASKPGGMSIPIFVRDIDDQDWGTNAIWGGGDKPIYINGKSSKPCH
jgi:RHS repeat-associated protein